jgi:hypothetical protein
MGGADLGGLASASTRRMTAAAAITMQIQKQMRSKSGDLAGFVSGVDEDCIGILPFQGS